MPGAAGERRQKGIRTPDRPIAGRTRYPLGHRSCWKEAAEAGTKWHAALEAGPSGGSGGGGSNLRPLTMSSPWRYSACPEQR